MCYLVDSETLVFLPKIRNGVLKRRTTTGNTDTRLGHNEFFKENRPRNCDARVGRGDGVKYCLEYLEMVSGGAMDGDIQELRRLMGGRPIDRKGGCMSDRVVKQLIYGENKYPKPN